MPLLPKPYPDEVVGSVIARACWHSGVSLKRLLSWVVDGSRSNYSFLMAANCRRLALLSSTGAEELLMQHTMFPYAVAFMPPTVRVSLVQKALDLKSRDGSLSSLTKNISHGVPYRRVCPACVEEDKAKLGESYWRRSHLLPGALVCLRHDVKLRQTAITLRGNTQGNDIFLPHMVETAAIRTRLPLPQLRLITEGAIGVLRWDIDADNDWRQRYRSLAVKQGYVLASGDVAGHALASSVRRYFGSRFLEEAGCPIGYDAGKSWPALMVRPKGGIPFATPKHVFMQILLAQGRKAPEDVIASYRPPGKKARDYPRMDARVHAKLKTRVKRAAARNERLTVRELLTDVAAWAAFRHNRDRFPRTNTFIQEFRRSKQAKRQQGGRQP